MKPVIFLAFFVTMCSVFDCRSQEEIRFVDGSLAAILSIAQERNKNIFIDTYADWCIPCKRMEEKFKNRDVAAFFNEHFINYRVNMQNPTRANDLRKRYDVVFLPTMYILDPNGVVKYQADRELSVSELLNAGQRSLDPTSYNESDATLIRRKDGTTSGGSRKKSIEPSTTVIPAEPVVTDDTPASAAPIVADVPDGSVPLSSSAATRRSQILDQYETVEESSTKVLAVLGAGDLPPEVLRQEAYLRLEFMDGSSKGAAKKYLDTQEDWGTEENRKFIMDFISSTSSDMYDYLIDHKQAFIDQFGEQKVSRTLEVLTYRSLYNAVPRPTLTEAIVLYQNIDAVTAQRKAHHYFINRLILEGNAGEVVRLCDAYLKVHTQDHQIKYTVAQYLSNSDQSEDEDLARAEGYILSAITDLPDSPLYLELLADVYKKRGKTKEAEKTAARAMKLAQKE